jgi:outer membrane protein
MRKIIITLALIFFYPAIAIAVTLSEALNETYRNNTELNAERENINASAEDINISKAEYMPSITLSGSKSYENTNTLKNQDGTGASISDVNPLTTSIKLEQTLIDKGRDAEYSKNLIGLEIAKARLLKKEQDILYSAIDAFTSLILAREKLSINRRNLNLLIKQVETDKVRLDRGQITTADLYQSESSLAGARAQFTQSKSELMINKLNYENIIGKLSDPNKLKKSSKSIVSVPNSLAEAIELSKNNNPDIKISKLELNQSEKDLLISEADLNPTASVSLERSYTEDLSATYDEKEKDILKATISWPFYSGGKKRFKINKNSNLIYRQRLLLESTIKTSDTNVGTAWSSLQSSKSFLNSVISQVRAAKIANEGIIAENQRGSRTTLDVIQSNSLLLSAEISLANSQRNYLITQYNLLKSIGLLNRSYLKLK